MQNRARRLPTLRPGQLTWAASPPVGCYKANKELCRQTDQEPVLTQLRRRKWNWLRHTVRRNDDSIAKQALRLATEIEGNHKRTCGKEIWRKKWTQQVSGTAGGRLRRHHNTELDGDE